LSNTTSQPTRRRSRKVFVRDLLVILLVAVVASVCIKTFLVRSFFIPSGSMEATLDINDRVLVNELVPAIAPISRGDVIVFTDPGGWLDSPPSRSSGPIVDALTWVGTEIGLVPGKDDHLIKRVIGLPGDRVACCNALGQLTVNGMPLKEPYVQLPPAQTAASGTPFSVVVPQDSLWVMGDNRYFSADSRAHMLGPSKGFVPYTDVVGQAFAITWPLSRISWLDGHHDVFGRTAE
jgi:signal peptidase I